MRTTCFLGAFALMILLFAWQGEALGASGLFGIDLGTDSFKVMTLAGNSPEIVLNDQSGRKSASLVGFTPDGERVFGSRAAQLAAKFPDRVISSAPQFLGKNYPDSDIEAARHLFPFALVNNTGAYGFQIGDDVYSPEEIVGMLIEFAHGMASENAKGRLTDVALVIPPYLTQAQRQGYVNAARIANVNVVLLASEGTATSVDYLRTRLLTAEDLNQFTIFYNVGHSHTSATLSNFQIEKVKSKINRKISANATTWSDVGGRDFDYRLTQALLKQAEEQLGEDFSTNKRVIARLGKEARKAKEVLSANKEARVRVESLWNDRDFATIVSRDEFEAMCEDLFKQVLEPLRELVSIMSHPLEETDVEVVGGGSRVIKISNYLNDMFGVERVGRHLNGDESSLQGAMVYAASGSAGKRASITIKDSINHAVDLLVNLPEKEPVSLFSRASRLRSHKNRNVLASETFTCDLVYQPEETLSSGLEQLLGTYEVSGFPEPGTYTLAEEDEDGESPTVKLRFDIDARGLIECTEAAIRIEETVVASEEEDVVVIEDVEVLSTEEAVKEEGDAQEPTEETAEEPTEEEPIGEEDPQAAAPTPEPSEDAEEPAADTAEGEDAEVPSEAAAPTPTPRKKRILPLTVKKTTHSRFDDITLLNSRSLLAKLNREDRNRRRREETKNELESYVYATLDLLEQDAIRAVTTEDEREQFPTDLMEAGDWLYDDGEDATLEDYQEKLAGLKATGDRISLRASEVEAQPAAAAAFHEWKEVAMALLKDITEERNVREEEKSELVKSIQEAEEWLEQHQEQQAGRQPHEDPVWESKDLLRKVEDFQKTMARFMRRRIRTPTPSPTPTLEATEDEASDEEDPFANLKDILFSSDDAEGEEIPLEDAPEEDPTAGLEDPIPIHEEL